MTFLRLNFLIGVPIVGVLAAVVTWYFAGGTSEFAVGYPIADMGPALYSVSFSAPIVASWTALVVGTGSHLLKRPIRPMASALRVSLSVGAGAATAWMASVVTIVVVSKPSLNQALIVKGFGPLLWGLLGAASIGMLLAICITRFLAIPLAAAVTWVWFSLPQGSEMTGARNANIAGPFILCCSRLEEPSMLAWYAGLVASLVTSALAVAALVLWQRGLLEGVIVRLGVAVVVIVMGLGSGVVLGSSGSPMATQARTGDETCRTSGDVRVCVFPEAAEGLADFSNTVQRVRAAISSTGIRPPTSFGEDASKNDVGLEWNPQTPTQYQVGVVVQALLIHWRCDPSIVDDLTGTIAQEIQSAGALSTPTKSVVQEHCLVTTS